MSYPVAKVTFDRPLAYTRDVRRLLDVHVTDVINELNRDWRTEMSSTSDTAWAGISTTRNSAKRPCFLLTDRRSFRPELIGTSKRKPGRSAYRNYWNRLTSKRNGTQRENVAKNGCACGSSWTLTFSRSNAVEARAVRKQIQTKYRNI